MTSLPSGHYKMVCQEHMVGVGQCRCYNPNKAEYLVPCPGPGKCRGALAVPDSAPVTVCATCALPIRHSDLIDGWTHVGPFLHPKLPMHDPAP